MQLRYDPERHHRHSIRLPRYDYSSDGLYFVTICCWQKECILGEVTGDEVSLSDAGQIVEKCWLELPSRFASVDAGIYVVMPNHMHGVLRIANDGEDCPALGSIIRAYKSLSAIAINRVLGRSERPVWQRNYYEHIIQDEKSLESIHR